jgi:hypothetical protein
VPPRRFSRHSYTLGIKEDGSDALELTDREPFPYRDLSDNRQHVVQKGETLFTLAGAYFRPMERAAGLWWVIADFQPDPIIDPTIELTPGAVLYIPSLRVVEELIFDDARRDEAIL